MMVSFVVPSKPLLRIADFLNEDGYDVHKFEHLGHFFVQFIYSPFQ